MEGNERSDGAHAPTLTTENGWTVVRTDDVPPAFSDIRGLNGGALCPARPVERDTLDELAFLFRERRRAMGARRADALWIADPLETWLTCIGGADGGDGLDRESVAMLAVGMREALCMRDALAVSVIVPDAGHDRLVRLASRPHAPENVGYLSNAIEGTFRDASFVPDLARCGRGLAALAQIVASVPESHQTQPLAVIAYLLWWMGHAHATHYALCALAQDGRCTLAAIVLSASEHGLRPAWSPPLTEDGAARA